MTEFVCPLCRYAPYRTTSPDKYWWHLATAHRTTEKKLVIYAQEYARGMGWTPIYTTIQLDSTVSYPTTETNAESGVRRSASKVKKDD